MEDNLVSVVFVFQCESMFPRAKPSPDDKAFHDVSRRSTFSENTFNSNLPQGSHTATVMESHGLSTLSTVLLTGLHSRNSHGKS